MIRFGKSASEGEDSGLVARIDEVVPAMDNDWSRWTVNDSWSGYPKNEPYDKQSNEDGED